MIKTYFTSLSCSTKLVFKWPYKGALLVLIIVGEEYAESWLWICTTMNRTETEITNNVQNSVILSLAGCVKAALGPSYHHPSRHFPTSCYIPNYVTLTSFGCMIKFTAAYCMINSNIVHFHSSFVLTVPTATSRLMIKWALHELGEVIVA
jgi:hypothetical protein